MNIKNKIILGSSSIFRRQLMDEFGFKYTTASPDINEKGIRDKDPTKLVLMVSITSKSN